MAPFLILVVGVRPVTAVAADLVYSAVTKIVGAWVHPRQDTVDMPVVRKLATGSIPGGLLGVRLVILLPRRPHNACRRRLGYSWFWSQPRLIARMLILAPASTPPVKRIKFLYEKGTVIWGAVVGFCVGATSLGKRLFARALS